MWEKGIQKILIPVQEERWLIYCYKIESELDIFS